MFKLVIVSAMLALTLATPVPSPKAKPQVIVDPYYPWGAVAPVAYTAPVAYPEYVLPSVYAPAYSYSPYVAEPVVVY